MLCKSKNKRKTLKKKEKTDKTNAKKRRVKKSKEETISQTWMYIPLLGYRNSFIL